ncbi:ATP-binding protein, partial [Mycobacterium intracellulare]|uniref:ATP-binding protein n=1 Tax=Mycobacterium intracellulare TaxID=1767 RepID=UPI002ECB150B|nr:ATP-binding protein [Mycobacterium intracellulare]
MRFAEPISTLVSTATEMPTMTSRVDPQGARRMMEMLVNLYADRRLAVVREYVSNAVDATRAAGSGEPVAVTTPTLIEPNFVVTDRGTGMSMAEVEATFLAFAASSKRDSNELIGGLGVGAKSAWTLAESFLVDTVKGGRRTTVRAARNLEHQVLVAGEPSDLPDGTTVIVPVEVTGHVDTWNRIVREVASAHDRGAVRVDGAAVDSLAGGPTWIGPVACRRVQRQDRATVIVRSGGTLFSAVPEVTSRVLESTRLLACVIELPIGSFDHTPSRESVIASDRTMAAVDAALKQYRVAYDALAQRITKLADTDVAAAVTLRADTLGTVGTNAMLPVPFHVSVPAGSGAWTVRNTSGRPRWERVNGLPDDRFEAATAPTEFGKTLVVSGVPAGRVVARFAKYLEENHPMVRRVIAVPEGQKTVSLNVLAPGLRKTDQTWEIGADTKGIAAHYTFEQWTAAMTARRTTRGPVNGYDCFVIDIDGATPRTATLSGPQIAALGIPVVYTDGERPMRAASGQPAMAMVYLGRRKTGPLLAAVPAAMSRGTWITGRFDAVTAGWSPTDLLAVIYIAFRRAEMYRPAFEVAVSALAAVAASGAEHPHRDLLTQIADIVRAAEKVTDARVTALQELEGTTKAVTECDKLRKLHSQLHQA